MKGKLVRDPSDQRLKIIPVSQEEDMPKKKKEVKKSSKSKKKRKSSKGVSYGRK